MPILTGGHTVFGSQEWRLNRIGVPPDVAVSPSPDDAAAGRDRQREAALDCLQHQMRTAGGGPRTRGERRTPC
jgi:hypothetical protein